VFLTVVIYYHSFTYLSTGNLEINKKHFPPSIKARRETFCNGTGTAEANRGTKGGKHKEVKTEKQPR
jgi:hypothetical protein